MKKNNITYFAKANFRKLNQLFGIKDADRAYHIYILGKTGVGKSNLLLSFLVQDLMKNKGLCVFDVHGDLIKETLKNIPEHRRQDVIHVDIPNPKLTLGYNPLKKVKYEYRSLVASGILDALQKLFGRSSWGPRMEHILRMVLLTLLDQPKTDFSHISKLLLDEGFRKKCLKHIINPDVKQFWIKEFSHYKKGDISPILNKIGAFLVHPAVRRILLENKDSLSFTRTMNQGKILLVNLNKGLIGHDVANVLGGLFLSAISSAAFFRSSIPESKRIPFYLYLDEFQNYSSLNLIEMLSELRKYKVSITFAHQFIRQVPPEVRDSVFGNVGTIIVFRISAQDATYITKELFDEHKPPLSIGDYVYLPRHHIYLSLMIDGTASKVFSAITLYYKEFLKQFFQ